ncbi:unnamed protein product [Tenebrio molitor]|nr:unnamed protein product [Tenebrio molitor]
MASASLHRYELPTVQHPHTPHTSSPVHLRYYIPVICAWSGYRCLGSNGYNEGNSDEVLSFKDKDVFDSGI